MKPENYNISKEKLVFRTQDPNIHDKKLETKPVGYLKDAWYRFRKNKGSIVAAIIIIILLLFALIVPMLSRYKVADEDINYKFALPRNEIFVKMNIPFWDGREKKELPKDSYLVYKGIEEESGKQVIFGNVKKIVRVNLAKKEIEYYQFRLDSYQAVGTKFKNLTKEEYESIQKYQDETGIQVIYPITEYAKRPQSNVYKTDANYWFQTKNIGEKIEVVLDENGDFVNIYQAHTGKDGYTSRVRIEGEDNKLYDYARVVENGNQYEVRVNYYEYYRYYHTYVLGDKIKYPSFLFGATDVGKDVLTCLSSGARFSFLFAILVAVVNLFVGAIYGAIEGYYGGKADMIMERIVDVLAAIPFMIVITLLKYHMTASQILILFIAFFLTGWIGMASRTRMQFYRFKNQEYVLAARTLGANDRRIMFKHIFPNAIGTLITGCVLVIPGVIFSETSLSYLGIINLDSGNLTSVGTLLAKGQQYLFTYPHIIIFPAIFISLLMLSFNLFGNGLRDAFNPSLRGTEE